MLKGLLCLCGVALISGCANSAIPKDENVAECPVCRHNADLACLYVKVDESTLRLEVAGTTQYFCSDECRSACARQPAKYLATVEKP